MRVVQAKPQRAERRSEIGGVELPLGHGASRKYLFQAHFFHMIHHVLQSPETSDVGLGFFDRAVQLLHLFPGSGVAALDPNRMGAQAVHQFVRQNVGEERLELHVRLR